MQTLRTSSFVEQEAFDGDDDGDEEGMSGPLFGLLSQLKHAILLSVSHTTKFPIIHHILKPATVYYCGNCGKDISQDDFSVECETVSIKGRRDHYHALALWLSDE